jgi:hypothetical protein
MTVPLSPQSPRRDIARRFGVELRDAMAERGIGTKTLAPQVPCATSAIANWRSGYNLPTLKATIRLSEALQWPKLLEIAQEARMGVCPVDGTVFSNEGGKPKLYCTSKCRTAAEKARQRGYVPEPDIVLAKEIERLATTPGAVRKRELKAAVGTFRSTRNKGVRITIARDLDRSRAAVEAFCRSCEWDGFCKTPECELRPVSPLPLETRIEIPDPAQPALGRWGQPGASERHSDQMRARYEAEPERRQAHSERTRAWWAGMTPAERVAWGQKVSASRKGQATYRACGCPNRAHRSDCPTREQVPA